MRITGKFIQPMGVHQFSNKQLAEISKQLTERDRLMNKGKGKSQEQMDNEIAQTTAMNPAFGRDGNRIIKP